MAAESLTCPSCSAVMEQVVEPDLRYERCPDCQALFLDRGELNVLATEMAGDIEFCSIEMDEQYPDSFPARRCPKCPDHTMKKEDLLVFSGLIFDYCANCHGWFLDRGELTAMNAKLAEIRRSQGGDAEYRGHHREHLVTITEISDVVTASSFGMGMAVTTTWRRVEVYYLKPLAVGLRISPETWGSRLWGLLGARDLQTGDDAFDKTFLVKADEEPQAVKTLGPQVCAALLAFHASSLARLGKKQCFEVRDDRLLFAYSDWGDADAKPSPDEVQRLIDGLVDLAAVIGEE